MICEDNECIGKNLQLQRFEELLEGQDYLVDSVCSFGEKDRFKSLDTVLIDKLKLTFPKLFNYMQRMTDLLSCTFGPTCSICKQVFNHYFKFENLIYGFKEDKPVCEPCYYKHLEKLINFGRELGQNLYFQSDISSKE